MKNSNNQIYITFKFWEKIIFILLLILIATSPYLFTRETFSQIDFTRTGPIGDTIGGLTAPFVNILAAFLVYKSFVAQINANKEQRDNHNEQMDEIRKENSVNYIFQLSERVFGDYREANKNNSGAKYFIDHIRLSLESYLMHPEEKHRLKIASNSLDKVLINLRYFEYLLNEIIQNKNLSNEFKTYYKAKIQQLIIEDFNLEKSNVYKIQNYSSLKGILKDKLTVIEQIILNIKS